ncbi:MAG: endolytic transglycosylase MltG [Pyrinomonadaceae bacterium]
MHALKLASAIILIAILAVGGFAFWTYRSLNSPHTHDKADQYITIEKGTTPAQIVSLLAAQNIIASETPAWLYLRTFGDASKLQAGEYQFESPITPLQVLKELEKGESRRIRITIPEGYTRFDIAKRIYKALPGGSHIPLVSEADILAMMDDTSLIRDIAPEAKNLEGYLYPSTYDLPAMNAAEGKGQEYVVKTLIAAMVEQFRKVWTVDRANQAKLIGRTPHEIVTIASMIETESPVEAERPVVASVIYNRLKRGMALGIDQTAVYVAKMEGRWDGEINRSDLDADSPYNTRKKFGLPPGPISSVSESAIDAALNPVQSDYLFYVRNVDVNDGSHWFYSSAAEFEKGKAKYQEWLDQQRAEKKAAEANRQ